MRDAATANAPNRVRERLAMRESGELAIQARKEKFPMLTAENFGEALAFQEEIQRAEYARLMKGPS